VKRKKRRRYKAEGTALSHVTDPNELWCADYKGEFMLADRRYCYPLTVTDFASRYLITCDALSTTKEVYAFSVFERAFKDFGLPIAIRTEREACPRGTTACRSPAAMPSTGCRSSRCGGCAWASISSASSRGTRNRTADMNACT